MLIDKREVARLLNCSVRQVDYYRQKGLLPYRILPGGRLVRFERNEVLKWAGFSQATETTVGPADGAAKLQQTDHN